MDEPFEKVLFERLRILMINPILDELFGIKVRDTAKTDCTKRLQLRCNKFLFSVEEKLDIYSTNFTYVYESNPFDQDQQIDCPAAYLFVTDVLIFLKDYHNVKNACKSDIDTTHSLSPEKLEETPIFTDTKSNRVNEEENLIKLWGLITDNATTVSTTITITKADGQLEDFKLSSDVNHLVLSEICVIASKRYSNRDEKHDGVACSTDELEPF